MGSGDGLSASVAGLTDTVTGGALTGSSYAVESGAISANLAGAGVVLTKTTTGVVTLSGANFGITDPDDAAFTYSVSGVSGGYFQLSSAASNPITTFSSAHLSGGLVQFVDSLPKSGSGKVMWRLLQEAQTR